MQFGLSETQQTIQRTARGFLQSECPMTEVRRIMETAHAHDEALWKKMTGQGWMGLLIPEEYGGSGMTIVEMAALLEEMGRALLPGPYFSTVLAGVLIGQAGSVEHQRRYLPAIASGDCKATIAMHREHGMYLFVPDAGLADLLICVDETGGDLSLFAVETASTRPMQGMDATRKLYEVTLTAGIPADVLARGEHARRALDHTLDVAASGLASEMTGGIQRVLEISVEYAKTRKQFGKPIGSFQAVQHLCADIYLYAESSRSAAYYAAWALSTGASDARTAVSVAKAYVSDAYREAGNRAIQVHGGMGFTWENDLHLYYRRAKASEIAFGDASFHRERVARLVIDHAVA